MIPMAGTLDLITDADVFLDTDVLIYAALGRRHAPEKFAVARRIVVEENYCTSAQVLAEFYANATRMGDTPLTVEQAQSWVSALAKKPCQPVDHHLVREATHISQRHKISYWDGAIIAAAAQLGAGTLYSEGLEHGSQFDSVRVINPFPREQ